MTTLTSDEMLSDPSACLQRVDVGETLVILQGDRLVAELRPILQATAGLQPYALCAQDFVVPDDFDCPLPDEILAAFEDSC